MDIHSIEKFTSLEEQVFAWSNVHFIWRAGICLGHGLGKVFPESREALWSLRFSWSWERVWGVPGGGAWQGPHGDTLGLKVVVDLASCWGMWDGHLQWLQGSEVQHSSHGHSPMPVHIFQRWYFRIVWVQGRKPRGWWWPPSRLQGQVLRRHSLFQFRQGGGLGAVALVGSSTLGVGEGGLFKEVGAMGSFLTPSHICISILNRLPSSSTGSRQSLNSCTALLERLWHE